MREIKPIKMGIPTKIRNNLMVRFVKLQKRYFTNKVSVFTLKKMNEVLVKEFVKMYGKKEGIERIFREAAEIGHEFMIELSANLKEDFRSIPAYAQAAWEMFSGHEPSHIEFGKAKIEEHEVLYVKFQDKNCPWCENILAEHNLCVFPAGAYNGAGQTWAELTGNPYNIFVRETQCKATGAPYCEWIFIACPKEMSIEALKEEHPEWFETISYGFFKF